MPFRNRHIPPNWQDKIIRAMVVLTCVLVLAGFLIGVATIFQVTSQGTALDAQQRSDEITGCRSSYRVELYDGPTYRALQALALGDDEALRDAAQDADPEQYEQLVALSRTDPEEFLSRCRSDEPGEGGPSVSTTHTTLPGPPFADCDEVEAAGVDPLRRGEPGYTEGPEGLDRDGDGVACEG